MFSYLVDYKGEKGLFFQKPNGEAGLLKKNANIWGDEKKIPGVTSVFYAYADAEVIHIISATEQNRLEYMYYLNGEWKRYPICGINGETKIKRIAAGRSDLGENLFLSADYRGENILISCLLGGSARPKTVDTMSGEDIFISNERVFYSNAEGEIGYRSFSNGTPGPFIKCLMGKSPYVFRNNGEEHILYIKNGDIYVDDKKYASDPKARLPVFVKTAERSVIMWQADGFIKYVNYSEESRGRKPMRYVSTGVSPDIFVLSDGRETSYYYGFLQNGYLKFFSNASPFASADENRRAGELHRKNNEIDRLKKDLIGLKKEIELYKAEIMKLNDILERIKKEEG